MIQPIEGVAIIDCKHPAAGPCWAPVPLPIAIREMDFDSPGVGWNQRGAPGDLRGAGVGQLDFNFDRALLRLVPADSDFPPIVRGRLTRKHDAWKSVHQFI